MTDVDGAAGDAGLHVAEYPELHRHRGSPHFRGPAFTAESGPEQAI
jgi:hypothetical protein